MQTKLALLSTGIGNVESIMALVKELRPDTEVFNIVDDSIVRSIAANGNVVPPSVFRRMAGYMAFAEEAGADAVLLTCSSISESVDRAQPFRPADGRPGRASHAEQHRGGDSARRRGDAPLHGPGNG